MKRPSLTLPFFAAPGPEEHRDRLLLMSYHFPPGEAAGSLRWQKFARSAAENGWNLDVITMDPASLRRADPRRLEELPGGTRVYGVPLRRTAIERAENVLFSLYQRVRARMARRASAAPNGGSPEPRAGSIRRQDVGWSVREPRTLIRAVHSSLDFARERRWARDAATLGRRLVAAHGHKAIITCGPPHMVHRTGVDLSGRAGIPLIADLRDPWSLVERLPEHLASPVWLWLARHQERRVMARAALVVMNTERASAAMRLAYPEAATRIVTVMNGFDREAVPQAGDSRRFTVAYSGTIYLDRNPRSLFRAAARVIRDLRLQPAEFGIDLMGEVSGHDGRPIEQIAEEEGIRAYVRTHAPGPRNEAMRFLADASMLVSLPQDSAMAIPSKVFEYLQFRAWILALAEPGSATEEALRYSGADVISPGDLDAITTVLRDRCRSWSRGGRPPRLADTNPQLSREAQARRLFEALEAVARRPGGLQAAGR